jgi:hypothetical protein
MSSFLSEARARARRPVMALPRPRLTVVTRMAPRAPRIPFAALVLALLVGGLVGLLLLNTSLQRGAYAATALRQTSSDLAIRQQQLGVEVAHLREPQRIAQAAQRLGMVSNDSPAFIKLSTGQVIGTPKAGDPSNQVDLSHATAGGASGDHHGSKVTLPVAGEANSLTSGPVEVKAPRQPGHRGTGDERQGHER